MADEAKGAAAPETAKMRFKGGIASSNPGEEFVRVDLVGPTGKFGMINRKTGFVAVGVGKSAEWIQAVKDKKLLVTVGARLRNDNYKINVVDPEQELVEDSIDVNAEETTLAHEA